ncbi:FkbM family methyltransferase [Granulicella sp. dw_53]|uniref:FkbM family methyltransferase n=1 Tax=Granulicella sp. dw_53 TaxID=2719792 RepID=UPI001BD55C31
MRSVNKPEYLLQPGALLRRVFGKHTEEGLVTVELPWKLPIEVNTSEVMGRTIAHHGLFEMSVVEGIFRLTEPDDVFLDVGANIGYMSSVAIAAGAKKIFSFEPHPELFKHLDKNRSLWVGVYPTMSASICVNQMAVSTHKGTAHLRFPEKDFAGNYGLASLDRWQDGDFKEVEVPTITLTEILEQCDGKAGVLKIDIEGHELATFNASLDVLSAGRIRDIIFEDDHGMESPVCVLLRTAGYTIFGLYKTIFGPVLLETATDVIRLNERSHEGCQNFIASRDPMRVKRRMAGHGFRCLAHPNVVERSLKLKPLSVSA